MSSIWPTFISQPTNNNSVRTSIRHGETSRDQNWRPETEVHPSNTIIVMVKAKMRDVEIKAEHKYAIEFTVSAGGFKQL